VCTFIDEAGLLLFTGRRQTRSQQGWQHVLGVKIAYLTINRRAVKVLSPYLNVKTDAFPAASFDIATRPKYFRSKKSDCETGTSGARYSPTCMSRKPGFAVKVNLALGVK
jgi:hypothetical protein